MSLLDHYTFYVCIKIACIPNKCVYYVSIKIFKIHTVINCKGIKKVWITWKNSQGGLLAKLKAVSPLTQELLFFEPLAEAATSLPLCTSTLAFILSARAPSADLAALNFANLYVAICQQKVTSLLSLSWQSESHVFSFCSQTIVRFCFLGKMKWEAKKIWNVKNYRKKTLLPLCLSFTCLCLPSSLIIM